MHLTKEALARYIDHTALKIDIKKEEIKTLCQEAVDFRFKSVCIRPEWISFAMSLLKGKGPLIVTVVGFPTGKESTEEKVKETKKAIKEGAQEIDMVLHYEELKRKNYAYVYQDIHQVVKAASPLPVKVILETCYLNEEEKIIACALSKAAGCSFVKTSTGFGSKGATVEDVRLMRRIVGEEIGVKASGGIRTREDALKMIEAGATRLGTSASLAIINGKNAVEGKY